MKIYLILAASLLWFIRTTRAFLFWFYLWQLKEYHLGRFLDHFRTEKGRRIFLNFFLFFKIILFALLLFFYFAGELLPQRLYLAAILTLIVFYLFLTLSYLFESIKFFIDFLKKELKKPVLTSKTIILIPTALIVKTLFLYILLQKFYFIPRPDFYWFFLFLLAFDILTPLVVSVIVFLIHAFSVIFFRNRIIKKAKEKRIKFKNLLVIGVTGSYGKTSTKEFLAKILSKKFKVLKTKERQNSEVGISRCVLDDLKPEHQIFVCEMGAYNRGGIKLLCDIIKPKIGVLTGINEQHMATFGSLENIVKTKYELIESLPEDGLAFFNARNKHCLGLYQQAKIKKYLYGQKTAFFGEENLLGAMAVAEKLGMTEGEISLALKEIENKIPGVQFKKGAGGSTIIDAAYSANPDSVIFHLDYLKTFPEKKIIIMPCLIELGKSSIEIHKKIGEKIAEICDLAIITTKDRFREIREIAGEKVVFLENPKEIFEKIKPYLKSKNVILLEGRVPQKLVDIL